MLMFSTLVRNISSIADIFICDCDIQIKAIALVLLLDILLFTVVFLGTFLAMDNQMRIDVIVLCVCFSISGHGNLLSPILSSGKTSKNQTRRDFGQAFNLFLIVIYTCSKSNKTSAVLNLLV